MCCDYISWRDFFAVQFHASFINDAGSSPVGRLLNIARAFAHNIQKVPDRARKGVYIQGEYK